MTEHRRSSVAAVADVEPSRAVLITGCSTGIGRATALRLVAAGWPVWATARRRQSISELSDAGCRLLELDVNDEESMAAAVAAVSEEHGSVGVLVNNAGYGLQGPIETTPMAEVRAQFETNVFGLIRLTQLVLPGMRAQRSGPCREPVVDGREVHASGWRLLPRHQARG